MSLPQCFIQALCCPETHSDLPCDRLAGSKLVQMVFDNPKLHANLECKFLTSIAHYASRDGSSFIRVQGREQFVGKTMAHLQGMLESITAEPQLTLSPPPPPSSSHTYSPPPPTKILSSRSPAPANSSKIAYYVDNLHFRQDIVEDTLSSLGPEATHNAILHRLNQLSISKTHHRSTVTEEPPVNKGIGHVTDHMTGPFVERVIRRDPKKLRPIVIDGSNVAMRYAFVYVLVCV